MMNQYQAVDREAIWAALFAYFQNLLTAPPWAAGTTYALGDVRVDPQGHLQKVTAPGTSGDAQPAWNDNGGIASDGSDGLEWTDQRPGFVSMGRKHIAPPELVTAAQPAMFLIGVKETHMPKPRGVPTKLALHGFIVIYLPAPIADEDIGAETHLAATNLNGLFKAIDAALEPDDLVNGVFTLNGMFSHCWIEGNTEFDPGIFGPQAAAILPIHILVP